MHGTMKRFHVPVIAVLGFVVGWSLSSAPEPPAAAPSTPTASEGHRKEVRKRALEESLLYEGERDTLRMRTGSIPEVLLMMKEHRHLMPGSEEVIDDKIARLIELGPAAAMNAMLANPITDPAHLEALAIAWDRKQPGEAVRYLRGRKKSYLVDGCLQAVLGARDDTTDGSAIASSEPEEKDETEEQTSESPEDTLPPPDSTAPEEPVTWNPATFKADDFEQISALSAAFAGNPDETIAKAVATGNRASRQAVMTKIMEDLPSDPKEWREVSRKLESTIQQLGLLPDSLPDCVEIGPDLAGSEVSGWVDRQPLALRRAWSPTIVDRWAQVDPQAAMAWAGALPEDANRNQTIQTGLVVWTHRDPAAASAYVDGLPAGDLREVAISNAAATWNCIDPTAARKWVEGLPESPGRKRALERLKR